MTLEEFMEHSGKVISRGEHYIELENSIGQRCIVGYDKENNPTYLELTATYTYGHEEDTTPRSRQTEPEVR